MTSRNIIVAGVVAAIVSILVAVVALSTVRTDTSVSSELGGISGPVINNPYAFANGVGIGNDGFVFNAEELTIGRGEDQKVWTNKLGRDVFVTYGQFTTDGTASSTYRLYAIATSSTSIPDSHDFTALVATSSALIDGVSLATSTSATTTNSVLSAVQNKGQGTIKVPAGWSLISFLQAVDVPACGGTGACEEATSTNRGFTNLKLFFRYFYKP